MAATRARPVGRGASIASSCLALALAGAGEADALAKRYRFVRIEGYSLPLAPPAH